MESILDFIPLLLARLHHTQALAHVRKYIRTIHALIASTPITPSNKTTRIFCLFHPFIEVDLLAFVDDFHLETEFILDQNAFIFTFVCSPHLSFDASLGMVYELLQDYLVLDDFTSEFNIFFKVCGHIA